MIKITQGVSDPTIYFKYGNLEYKKGLYEIYYSNKFVVSGEVDQEPVRIGVRDIHNKEVLITPVKYNYYVDD